MISAKQIQLWVYDHPYYFYLILFIFGAVVYSVLSVEEETRDFRRSTELYLAAEAGDLQQVIQLVDDGATIDGCDDCLWTPLMKAAQNGFVDVARVLLTQGADVNAVDKGGYSSLMLAAGDNRADMISLLARHNANLNIQDNTAGWTALIWASKEGHFDSVDRLLTAGADPDLKDQRGNTALDWAQIKGHHEIERRLNDL